MEDSKRARIPSLKMLEEELDTISNGLEDLMRNDPHHLGATEIKTLASEIKSLLNSFSSKSRIYSARLLKEGSTQESLAVNEQRRAITQETRDHIKLINCVLQKGDEEPVSEIASTISSVDDIAVSRRKVVSFLEDSVSHLSEVEKFVTLTDDLSLNDSSDEVLRPVSSQQSSYLSTPRCINSSVSTFNNFVSSNVHMLNPPTMSVPSVNTSHNTFSSMNPSASHTTCPSLNPSASHTVFSSLIWCFHRLKFFSRYLRL